MLMKQKLLLIIFLFIVVIFALFFKNQTFLLPIDAKVPCVYQAFGDVNQPIWVVSYMWSWKWISVWHVIDPNFTEDLGVGKSSGQIIWLWKNIQNIGNDIWSFDLQDVSEPGLIFNERICDTSFDGLITFVSWGIQKIPVQLSGTFIDYDPDYGQSGSPIFSWWKIIWVLSRKYDWWAIVSIID